MKLSNFAIPYPILGINGAFKEDVVCESNLEFESKKEEYVFKVSLSIDDPTILGYIRDGYAQYACEMDCAKTFYRHIYKSSEPSFHLKIPKKMFVGKVQVFLSVVVVKNIAEYQNENFNQRFYAGYRFNLTQGHMLAFFEQRTFNADIKYNELNALGTIMEVKADQKSKFTYFDFGGEMITIFLPQSEFENFMRSNNHTLSDITHASIVQCALISALTSYKEYSNTLWAQTLKARVQNDNKLLRFANLGELSNKEIVEMVSIMMDNPNRRMFEKLNTFRNE